MRVTHRNSKATLWLTLLVVLLSCSAAVAGFVEHRQGAFILFKSTTPFDTKASSQVAPSEPVTSSSSTSQAHAVIESPIILYDGVCNFCNAWVDLLLRIDVQKRYKFAPLQSDVGRKLLVNIGKDADDISSVLMIQPNLDYYEKSAAPLKVVEELGPLAGVLSRTALTIVPKEIRDSIYDTVAENRYNLMGKRDECRCSDPRFADRFVSS